MRQSSSIWSINELRFVHQLIACVIIILIVSAGTGLYLALPYEIQTSLTYRVDVGGSFGNAILLNGTSHTMKNMEWRHCENNQSSVVRHTRFIGVEDPNVTLTMKINVTLTRYAVPFRQCELNVPFTKQGEYFVVLSPIIFNIPADTYGLTVFYGATFNATRIIVEASWNSTLTLY